MLVYDEVVAGFASSQEPSILALVAMAVNNKAAALRELGHKKEANDVRLCCGDSDVPAITEQVDQARRDLKLR